MNLEEAQLESTLEAEERLLQAREQPTEEQPIEEYPEEEQPEVEPVEGQPNEESTAKAKAKAPAGRVPD